MIFLRSHREKRGVKWDDLVEGNEEKELLTREESCNHIVASGISEHPRTIFDILIGSNSCIR